ncbi:MAG: DUF4912 domain-containing protein [Candidatus Gygaella obscura]|nr:DUF4912 domain-containing protein [Candidatus Gygaella obscura]
MKKKKISKKKTMIVSRAIKGKKEKAARLKKQPISKKTSVKRIKKTRKKKIVKSADREKRIKFKPKQVYSGKEKEIIHCFSKIPSEEFVKSNLPRLYGKDMLKLLVRDPRWIYVYWEVTTATFDKIKDRLKQRLDKARIILRAYDVTGVDFNGKDANSSFDVEINYEELNWYINTNSPGSEFCVELGFLLENGEFIRILRSNTVSMPVDGPSSLRDEEWMFPDDLFDVLYKMSFGFHGSSPVGDLWSERLRLDISSGFSPQKKA